MALVGRVKRPGKEKDLIYSIVSENWPSGDEVWGGSVVLKARGWVEEAYGSSGDTRTAQGLLQVGFHYIWTVRNVLINKRCRI